MFVFSFINLLVKYHTDDMTNLNETQKASLDVHVQLQESTQFKIAVTANQTW